MQTQQVSLDKFFINQTYDIKRMFNEFRKPIFNNVFFKNIDSLRLNSDYVDFNQDKWFQQPTVFCMDMYKESQLFPVILLVNHMKSFLEFTPDYCIQVRTPNIQRQVIIVPYRSEIRQVLSLS